MREYRPSPVINEWRGLNLRGRSTNIDPRYTPDSLNADHLRETARARPSIVRTNYYDDSSSPSGESVTSLLQLVRDSGVRECVWFQGDDIYAKTDPAALSGPSAASGTQVDANLGTTTYPIKWRSVGQKPWGRQMRSRMHFCNAADRPMIYDEFSAARSAGTPQNVDEWGIYQPRYFEQLTGPVPSHLSYVRVFHGITPATAAQTALAYGNLAYAYTYYDAQRDVESNPSPIVVYEGINPASPLNYIGMAAGNPTSKRVTHIRWYRTRTGGSTLKRCGETEIDTGASFTGIIMDISQTGHTEKYGDAALLNAPELEYDHDTPPLLAGVERARNHLIGWTNWEEKYLAGRSGVIAGTAATATTTTGAGYVVTINSTAASGKAQEHHVGMTIRFPNGSNRKYTIIDVLEQATNSTQELLIGHNIGDDPTEDFFDQLDPDDENLATEDFIIESPSGRLYYTPANEPEYWPSTRYWSLDENDGEQIRAAFVLRDAVFALKENSLWRVDWSSSPLDGRPRRLSSSTGISSPKALAVTEEWAFWHAPDGHFYGTQGGTPRRIDGNLGFSGVGSPLEAVHDEANRRVIFFGCQVNGQGGIGLVYEYERDRWSPWQWNRGSSARSITASLYAPDSGGTPRVWLSDSGGFQWTFSDTFDGRGTADGHASTTDPAFLSKSTTTAVGAAGVIEDSANQFPDHTSNGASVIDDPVLVTLPTGDRLRGRVTGRTSSTVLTTDISSVIPLGSTYEIGVVHWYLRTPFMRMGYSAQDVDSLLVWCEPKTFDLNDRRHELRFYVQSRILSFSGVNTEADTDLVGTDTFTDFDVGGDLVTYDRNLDRWLVDYTSNTFAASGGASPLRETPNPGVFRVPCSQKPSLGAVSTFVQYVIGEEGTRLRAEILEIAPAVAMTEPGSR